MSFLVIDSEKCNKDGICADVCPLKIITMGDSGPALVNGTEELCIGCGHCVAVCPKGALGIPKMAPEDCLAVENKYLVNADQAEHFLRYRRSIRNFKDKTVDRKTLADVIRIASHAPSGHNTQPLMWQVVYEKDQVKRIGGLTIDWMRHMLKENETFAKQMHLDLVVAGWEAGLDTINRDAPHVILVNGLKDDPMARDVNFHIGLTYFDLALQSVGLGGCWNGFLHYAVLNWPPFREALELADDVTNFGAMMLGYPKYKFQRMPPRNEPKITWM